MSQTEGGDAKKRILAVDDAAIILTRITNTLQNDYEVITVNSGTRALKYLEQEKPDLILLDIQMAQKDGIETLKEIRAMKDRADIPVIMLTGVEDKDFVLKSAKLGICDYILKPFYSDDLTKRIRKVFAKEEKAQGPFTGEVAVVRQENNGYVMQVTVSNSGEDFTGTVQVVFAGADSENCAYNTEIALPAQGKKQFTVRVANTAVDTSQGGMCALRFLDREGDVLQAIELKNVFQNAVTEAAVGILSDHYAELGMMEAKGQTIDTNQGYYPVKLTELNNDNLKEHLNGLYYLIIDRFDVSSLDRENIEAVQEWVRNGGYLLVGTGAYGEQTLSGFDKDFMDVEVNEVSEPGEDNAASVNADPYGYRYTMYTNDGIDFTNMAIADLSYNRTSGSFYESSDNPALCSSVDKGGILVYYFSLGDEELQKLSSYTVASMYEEFKFFSYYQYNPYSEWEHIRERALAFIDNVNTDVDFTWLKVMILIYVVLIGPVLYLLLRKGKKCEWYWVCVPALGVLFIAGVYVLGQGARVKDTRVYSVTTQKVDGSRKDTYFMAYHSGTRPWEVRLQEDYEMAGPASGQYVYYYVGYTQNMDDYFYVIGNDSEGL